MWCMVMVVYNGCLGGAVGMVLIVVVVFEVVVEVLLHMDDVLAVLVWVEQVLIKWCCLC